MPQLIIGVPGLWADRSEIVAAIANGSGGYLLADSKMIHQQSKASCNVEVYPPDPQLGEAFAIAGGGKLSAEELSKIEAHTFTIYLLGAGGSFENVRPLMSAALALLDCGGLAVKIESAGLAHPAAQWRELVADQSREATLRAVVTYVGGAGEYYSCGMHNVGFRDATVTDDIPAQEAADLLDTFLHYLVLEEPTIHDGETFSAGHDVPRYRLTKTPCTTFAEEDLFHNPYGMWQLLPA